MRIVHAASELFPYLKTGGLADVVGALANALAERGHEVVAFLPGYRAVLDGLAAGATVAAPREFAVQLGEQRLAGELLTLTPRPGLTVRVVCRPEFFDRQFPYWTGGRDYDDNDARFIFFQKAVVEAMRRDGVAADVLHCHDWQTGLLPLLVRAEERRHRVSLAGRTVFTIHNVAYQGVFPRRSFALTNLPESLLSMDGVEYYGKISLLKAGILFADQVTTVSPRYAQEIQTTEFGCGLDGVIRTRANAFRGILNGIDSAVWNPAVDESLPARYSVHDLSGKKVCRATLLAAFGWDEKFAGPIFASVSRMTKAKGHDFILGAQEFFAREDCKLVVLGAGERFYEEAYRRLAAAHPARIALSVSLDEARSHLLEAGADFFLMPSLTEPCGLNQMYSQAYGTVPLTSRVGGLVDTVVDLDERPEEGTGLMFEPGQTGFDEALRRARALFRDKERLAAVRARGMRRDFSWAHAVGRYEQLYRPAP
ncbi:MAG: glycogen synthase GlgA [Opitutae bacterium]|nr:glycogen synthase GlgA [Opitutae bacterium]